MRKNQTLTAWYSLIMGAFGFHCFYLHGYRDIAGWLCLCCSCAGLVGVSRMLNLGQDDRIAWILIPILGCTITYSCAMAIYFALMPAERWYARYAPANALKTAVEPQKNGLTLLPAILGLLVGGGVFMATITFSIHKLFEVIYA
jgi:hypothetical protein